VDTLCRLTENSRQGVRARGEALILEPAAFDHQDAGGELFWGGRARPLGMDFCRERKKGIYRRLDNARKREMGPSIVVEFKRSCTKR